MTSSKPFEIFQAWFTEAQEKESSYPDAFTLATASPDGVPSARILLLKQTLPEGFVFFTNYNSHKSQELLENPNAHMLFHWKSLKKQIRVQGLVSKASEEISDNYWASRAPDSNLNALLSQQSSPLPPGFDYAGEYAELKKNHTGQPPRPENWGGFVLAPQYFEFWEEGEFRWHKREAFKLDGNGDWQSSILYP